MAKYNLVIPFEAELKTERGWPPLEEEPCTKFFVARFHFLVEEKQASRLHDVGEKISVLRAAPGTTLEHSQTYKSECEVIRHHESITSLLTVSENMRQAFSTLSANCKDLLLGSFSAELRGNVQTKVRDQFTDTFKLDDSLHKKYTTELSFKNSIGENTNDAIVLAPVYQRYSADIFLAWVDYLYIEYRRHKYGLRKRIHRYPEIEGNAFHRNREKFGIPIATAYFHKMLPQSNVTMLERDYVATIADPFEITIGKPRKKKTIPVNWNRDAKSLYYLCRKGMPEKWIDRKLCNLAKEELEELEMREAENTPWWYRHGPGASI